MNTGTNNSGHYNSGYLNSGHYNSGDYNSANYNSGDYNSGYHNSGDYNSGHYNSGAFNTDEPRARMFNKECDKKLSEIDIPYIYLPLTEWIAEKDMTDDQKKKNPSYKTMGGFLLERAYKEAWTIAWGKANESLKQKFLGLPNFDADIFFEITGIDVRKPQTQDCDGKIVEIDGKKYKLSVVD